MSLLRDFLHFAFTVTLMITAVNIMTIAVVATSVESENGSSIVIDPSEVASFEAIVELHKQMDDDLSGSVDLSESIEFVQDELQINDNTASSRQKAFHNEDSQITVEELWTRWEKADERNWTPKDVSDWLIRVVELPQYIDAFAKGEVDGKQLPRIASQNATYLINSLHVTNFAHRKKLQVKALDAVLFGQINTKYSYWKDLLLVGLLTCAIGGYWFAAKQKRAAEAEVENLSKHMEHLKEIEAEFNKLEVDRKAKPGSDFRLNAAGDAKRATNAEFEKLRKQLELAQRQLEMRGSGCAPLALQPLLKQTYEIELLAINAQKKSSLKEMMDARDMVEKLKRKQTSLVGHLRLAHGSNSEEVDTRMLSLKSKIEHITRAMEDCQQRWAQIESLCGFSVMQQSPTGSGAPSLLRGSSGIGTAASTSCLQGLPVQPSAASLHGMPSGRHVHQSFIGATFQPKPSPLVSADVQQGTGQPTFHLNEVPSPSSTKSTSSDGDLLSIGGASDSSRIRALQPNGAAPSDNFVRAGQLHQSATLPGGMGPLSQFRHSDSYSHQFDACGNIESHLPSSSSVADSLSAGLVTDQDNNPANSGSASSNSTSVKLPRNKSMGKLKEKFSFLTGRSKKSDSAFNSKLQNTYETSSLHG